MYFQVENSDDIDVDAYLNGYDDYTLVKKTSYWESPFLMKASILTLYAIQVKLTL